jgi:hypothetical protein
MHSTTAPSARCGLPTIRELACFLIDLLNERIGLLSPVEIVVASVSEHLLILDNRVVGSTLTA